MIEYNIEFAHIYSDKKFGKEQEKSIKILKKKIIKFLKKDKTYSTCVLIDEYNPEKNTLTIDVLLNELDKKNVYPHFIGLESKLASKKDFLLEHISNKKLRREYEKYINKNNHVPCSFLVAVWYLYRLGHLDLHRGIHRCYDHRNGFQAKKLVNILAKKYKESEKKAMEIIKNTKFSHCIKNIKTVFY